MAPSEFWRLPPRHFWWLLDELAEEQKAADARAGKLSDNDKDDLLEMMRQAGAEI